MTTNYPSALDNFTNPGPTDYEDVVSHSGQHSNANDAIEAIELLLGTANGSYLLSDYLQGWIRAQTPWVRISGTAFSPGTVDYTSIYLPQTKLRYYQGGTPLFANVVNSVYSGGSTIVNTIAGTNYSIGTSAIVNPSYSYQDNPVGFPDRFGYNPSLSNTSGTPSLGNGTLNGEFSITRGELRAWIYFVVGSTTNVGTGQIKLGLPLPESSDVGMRSRGMAQLVDMGTASYISQAFMDSSGSSEIRLSYTAGTAQAVASSTSPFTWGTGDSIEVEMIMKI